MLKPLFQSDPVSNKGSLNPKAAKSKHLPGETYVLCLRSLGSTWPRHPRQHRAASTFIAPSTFTRCSTPGALLPGVTWLLVRRSENGVWLPHCRQTALLEEALGSWVHVPHAEQPFWGLHLPSSILRAAHVEGGNRKPCGMMASGGHRPLGTVSNLLPAAQGSPKSILSITNPPTATQRNREPRGQSSGPGQSFGSADITAAVCHSFL